jgi:hypothetical protein
LTAPDWKNIARKFAGIFLESEGLSAGDTGKGNLANSPAPRIRACNLLLLSFHVKKKKRKSEGPR